MQVEKRARNEPLVLCVRIKVFNNVNTCRFRVVVTLDVVAAFVRFDHVLNVEISHYLRPFSIESHIAAITQSE
ncbi:hypothetical protein NVP1024O_53 [Vibrio phage 1.024.O._10N.261.45.F8]|nr:hypothetical protein NVP1024O_53 [Vibrio phage 1.024.O._10N.261.45.F8]